MPPTVRAAAQLLIDRGSDAAPSTLWPSLYRHLAHWPAFLGFACVLVPPEFEAIDACVLRIRHETDKAAAVLAARLKAADGRLPPDGEQARQLQAAIEQFSGRIPEMIVIGNLLRGALPGTRQDTQQPHRTQPSTERHFSPPTQAKEISP